MEKNNDKFTPDKVKKEHKMDFKSWWNNKALPTMSKLGNQRHLSAIRDSFGTMIPLIIAGGDWLINWCNYIWGCWFWESIFVRTFC